MGVLPLESPEQIALVPHLRAKSYVEARLRELISRYLRRLNNADNRKVLQCEVIDALKTFVFRGILPDLHVDSVLVRNVDGGTGNDLEVVLPMALRLWFNLGEASQHPRYSTDCKKCTFLGRSDRYDFYFCDQAGVPTVVARYGDDGRDYQSGLLIGKQLAQSQETEMEPLAMAYTLAVEKGLINDQVGNNTERERP